MSDDVEEDVPLYPEEFIGWRGWIVEGGLDEPRLMSASENFLWEPGQAVQAECARGALHKHVPWTRCSCGIYATKTLHQLRMNQYHNIGVIGQVSLWGHMVDGGKGWRAEFAYPKTIYVPYLLWRIARGLEVYGVPVKLLNPYKGTPKE